jgi:hypothetical protein
LLADLRALITRSSAPSALPDEILLACFSSRLLSLPLEARPTVATPDVFRLFTDILTLIPPPPLVDAICLAIDATLRRPPQTDRWDREVIAPEEINAAYAKRVCTRSLAKALCGIVALGPDYASSAVFAALRYFIESTEFNALCVLNSQMLVRLSETDHTGVVHRAAQDQLIKLLLSTYSALSFPKPEFSLSAECMDSRSPFALLISFAGLFLTNPAGIDIDATTITSFFWGMESVVVPPSLNHVCWHPSFLRTHSHPAGKVAIVCPTFSSSLILSSHSCVQIHSGWNYGF